MLAVAMIRRSGAFVSLNSASGGVASATGGMIRLPALPKILRLGQWRGLLLFWAGDRAIGAKHTTIAGFWTQETMAVSTFIEENTRVGRHRFLAGEAAEWTRDG